MNAAASGQAANRAATVTAVNRRLSFLDEIRLGWTARGWDPADLDRYRLEDPPTPPPPAPPPAAPPGPDAAQLAALQQTIDAATATASQQARDEAIAAALKDTGFASLEELQAAAKAKLDADNAAKDEATRAREAADREKAAATAALADAARAVFGANLQTFLVQCGVPAASLNDTAVLVTAELAGRSDATADEVVDAAAKVRGRNPTLFAAAAPAGGAPSGVPGKPPPGTPPVDEYETAREAGRKDREAATAGAPMFAGMTVLGHNTSN